MTDAKPLAGKAAVVTGASRGIGKAIALEFARAGADLAILSRTEAELNKVAEEARALGVKCHVVAADLADPASAQSAADQVGAKLGKVDVLMNNAGADLPIPSHLSKYLGSISAFQDMMTCHVSNATGFPVPMV